MNRARIVRHLCAVFFCALAGCAPFQAVKQVRAIGAASQTDCLRFAQGVEVPRGCQKSVLIGSYPIGAGQYRAHAWALWQWHARLYACDRHGSYELYPAPPLILAKQLTRGQAVAAHIDP